MAVYEYFYTYNWVIQDTANFNDPAPTAFRAFLLSQVEAERDIQVADPDTWGELYIDATQVICSPDAALDQSVEQWSFYVGGDPVTVVFPEPYVSPSEAASIPTSTGTYNYFIMRKAIGGTTITVPTVPRTSTGPKPGTPPGVGDPTAASIGVIRRGTLNWKRSLTWGAGQAWTALNKGRGVGYTYISAFPFTPGAPGSIRSTNV